MCYCYLHHHVLSPVIMMKVADELKFPQKKKKKKKVDSVHVDSIKISSV